MTERLGENGNISDPFGSLSNDESGIKLDFSAMEAAMDARHVADANSATNENYWRASA